MTDGDDLRIRLEIDEQEGWDYITNTFVKIPVLKVSLYSRLGYISDSIDEAVLPLSELKEALENLND